MRQCYSQEKCILHADDWQLYIYIKALWVVGEYWKTIVFQGGYHVEATIEIFSKPTHHLKEAFFFFPYQIIKFLSCFSACRLNPHLQGNKLFWMKSINYMKRPNLDQIYELCIGHDFAWLMFNKRAQSSSRRSHTSKEMKKESRLQKIQPKMGQC